jgi:hypothetical protein
MPCLRAREARGGGKLRCRLLLGERGFLFLFPPDATLINRGPNICKSLKRLSLDPLKTSCLARAAGTLTRPRASAPAANPRAAATFPAIARSPWTSSAGGNSISSSRSATTPTNLVRSSPVRRNGWIGALKTRLWWKAPRMGVGRRFGRFGIRFTSASGILHCGQLPLRSTNSPHA